MTPEVPEGDPAAVEPRQAEVGRVLAVERHQLEIDEQVVDGARGGDTGREKDGRERQLDKAQREPGRRSPGAGSRDGCTDSRFPAAP
jgi:hypothetical protein